MPAIGKQPPESISRINIQTNDNYQPGGFTGGETSDLIAGKPANYSDGKTPPDLIKGQPAGYTGATKAPWR
jgi:hypothetical protein